MAMNVSLSLTPEAEKRLAARAAQQGKSLQGLIQDIVEMEASAGNDTEVTGAAQSTTQLVGELPSQQDVPDDYDDETPWRGVFAPAHERKTIFTTEMQFRIADLPRRKPQVTISPRWVDDDE
jgi:hypothetical protein